MSRLDNNEPSGMSMYLLNHNFNEAENPVIVYFDTLVNTELQRMKYENTIYVYSALLIFIQICHGVSYYPELLYKTRNEQFDFETNCLYYFMTTFGRVYTLVPYCVRSPDVSVFPSSVLDRVTFTLLYKLNITSETLLIDHAPIDMIEDYEIYRQRRQLNMNTNDSDENLYYICMPPLFGTKCQFTFPADISMATMISLLYEWRTNSEVWDVLEQTNGTCIEGIHCDGRNLCLDWREICNGYVDCLNGKDEEFCFELEMNECDPLTEYRCSNGLCISKNFFYDLIADCLDKSDEIVFYDRQCYNDVSWYCEDTTCNPYKLLQVTISSSRPFSCGDGGCIEIARADPSSHLMRRPPFGCTNGRDVLYKRQLFQPTNECLNYLRCAFIFPMAKSECQLLCSSKYTCNAQVKLKCVEIARADPSSHLMRRPPFGCTNGRDVLYKRQLFQPTNECLNYLRCAFIFPMAKSECQLLCSSKYTCNAQVKLKCVNQSLIMFPLKPIYDNHVYFLYALNRTHSWYANFVPTFICFDSIRCLQYRVTHIIYNRTCSYINQFGAFHQIEHYGDWKIIFKLLHTTFGGCSLPRLALTKDSTCPHSSLFHCSNSSKCISQHRLQDHVIDCYNGTDENYNDTCDLALPHRFQCKLEKRCIPRRFLIDSERHCIDGSDESFTILCTNTSIESCDILAGRKEVNEIIPFGEICDGIERIQPTIQDQDTDETDCDEYSCVSRYTACNGQWNCRDGSDEHTCENTLSAEICGFNGEEFFCIQPDGNSFCASVEVIDDGKIDCLGASDEREYCRNKYPYEFERRYRCLNDSKCISPYQICDCRSDCLLGDDESLLLCPWKSSCDRTNFPCLEFNIPQNQRCDGQTRCKYYEDEWLCDLIDQPLISPFTLPVLSLFKPVSQRSTRKSYTFLGWYCNRGVPIQSTADPNSFQCFCPPAYYGNRCEYQRKRLSLILEINIPTLLERTNVYKFFIFLIQTSNGSIVFHAEEIIYAPYVQCLPKYTIDLLYPIERRENIKHHIRIQIYRLANSSIEYRGAWFFPIKFEFLYVNRIASQIILSEEILKNTRTNCQTLPCLHGSCELYLNNPGYSFCHCKPGWSGSLCNVKHPQECDCSPDSLCVIPGICICPLNKIGSRCYLDYNPCQDNPCRNHGICVATDIRITDAYCVCDEGYFGRNCEHIPSRLDVFFNRQMNV
ncbi:unnamed protein product [Adineta ricciae]|uniref:EGF-like domain-containing protein n=1 Tax=Adineta ricciae TaxID=249248 RepID=A0A814SYB7_ADIRI|nr:unnamed protein product [Adineta ricciae]